MRIFLPSHHWADPSLGAPGADHRLAEALRSLGHEAETFFFDDAFAGWRSPGRWAQLVFPWQVARRSLARAVKGEIDVIETTAGDGWVVRLALGALRRRPLFAVRTHGIERKHFLMEKALSATEGRTLSWRSHVYLGGYRLMEVERDMRSADLVVVHSREDESFALDALGIQPDRLFVIPCGIAEGFHASVPEFDPDRIFRVLFLGSWIPRKGVDLLPGILERLLSDFPQARLTLAGTGADRDDVLRGFGEAAISRIKVVPRIENRAVPSLMSEHGTFLFPSRCEGFGLVLVEAMARGLIVVSSSAGVASEILADGSNGFLVEEVSAEAFAEVLRRIFEARTNLAVMAATARKASERYSWRRSAERRVELYREFAGRRARREAGGIRMRSGDWGSGR